jgi:hypothetical protein
MKTPHLLKHESLEPTEGESDRILQNHLDQTDNDARQLGTTTKHQKALPNGVRTPLLLRVVRSVK